MDGDIQDKLVLDKYDGDEKKTTAREKMLYEWLEEKGL